MTTQSKILKMLCVSVFAVMATFLTSNEAKAQTVYPNDGKIEYIKVKSDGLEIKLTRAGISYAEAYFNAKKLAERVVYHYERAVRVCRALSITRLALQIQSHALAYNIPPLRGRANPVNVRWSEIT